MPVAIFRIWGTPGRATKRSLLAVATGIWAAHSIFVFVQASHLRKTDKTTIATVRDITLVDVPMTYSITLAYRRCDVFTGHSLQGVEVVIILIDSPYEETMQPPGIGPVDLLLKRLLVVVRDP